MHIDIYGRSLNEYSIHPQPTVMTLRSCQGWATLSKRTQGLSYSVTSRSAQRQTAAQQTDAATNRELKTSYDVVVIGAG